MLYINCKGELTYSSKDISSYRITGIAEARQHKYLEDLISKLILDEPKLESKFTELDRLFFI